MISAESAVFRQVSTVASTAQFGRLRALLLARDTPAARPPARPRPRRPAADRARRAAYSALGSAAQPDARSPAVTIVVRAVVVRRSTIRDLVPRPRLIGSCLPAIGVRRGCLSLGEPYPPLTAEGWGSGGGWLRRSQNRPTVCIASLNSLNVRGLRT